MSRAALAGGPRLRQMPVMKIIDPAHPFYKPLWRRVVIVTVVALWLAFEVFVGQNPFWIAIVGAVLVYSGWTLLFAWRDDSST